jgi:hypothetical protein
MPKDMRGVMKEFAEGKLHSGSKSGPKVTSRKQAIAIGLSEQRQLREPGSNKFKKAARGLSTGSHRPLRTLPDLPKGFAARRAGSRAKAYQTPDEYAD